MDSSFRSTVLHRHDDDRDRERDRERERDRDRERERRDVMNPASSHRHSTFSLRSPSTEFHPPLPYAATANPHHQSPPRLHQSRSPYMPSSTPASSGAAAHPLPPAGHHYGPVSSASPLHPPSAYYPPPASTQQQPSASSISTQSPSADSHHHHLRDKQPQPASGRVYDPTTDTTKERPIADSRHNAPPVATPKVSSSTLAIVHFHFSALKPTTACTLPVCARWIELSILYFFFLPPFLQSKPQRQKTEKKKKERTRLLLPTLNAFSRKPPIHHPCHATSSPSLIFQRVF
ncbi:hypothetical protein LI328DRAFT_117992 [Trichoderma asperelloides]|nr:hypothetical protein LI328DRAFT_117992 [Trichoderma asperelloides]